MGKHSEKRLLITLCISLSILIMEVIGGILSNSLALLSDAGHVFTDSLALSLSLLAAVISRKPSDSLATFGYQRIGLLAAIINGFSLLGIAFFIFFEGYQRFISPPAINSTLMLWVAIIGLFGNLIMATVLSKGHHDLNIKSAWLHIMGDLLASTGVVIAAVVIILTGFRTADPIASVIVALLILVGGIRVVWEALRVFLEMAPAGFNLDEIERSLLSIPEVEGVHDIHLWSISHGTPSFSAHIWIAEKDLIKADLIRSRIESILSDLGISHTILQLESSECDENIKYCGASSRK